MESDTLNSIASLDVEPPPSLDSGGVRRAPHCKTYLPYITSPRPLRVVVIASIELAPLTLRFPWSRRSSRPSRTHRRTDADLQIVRGLPTSVSPFPRSCTPRTLPRSR